MSVEIRKLGRAEIEPLLPALNADGLDTNPDAGEWFGALRDEEIIGVAQICGRDGVAFLDDVWVRPAERRAGIGKLIVAHAAAKTTPIWLICDEDAVDYYAGSGFERVGLEDFPQPLAKYYAGRGEWPEASDHVHVAMRHP